jgi:FtsP/CotA-like multicopper oxidase with cupredoxin domain
LIFNTMKMDFIIQINAAIWYLSVVLKTTFLYIVITNRVKAVLIWENRIRVKVEIYMKDIAKGKTRRDFLKGTAVVMAVPLLLTLRKGEAQTTPSPLPPSPATIPWQETLPNAVTPLQSASSLDPYPTEAPNLAAGECGRAYHQRFGELGRSPEMYEMTVMENPNWVFNPAYPPQPIWGFTGDPSQAATTPGPTIFARYGRPIICRIYNQLPYVSRVPSILRPLRQPTAAEITAAPVRRWLFERRNGMWAVNGEFLDVFSPRAVMRQGSAEIWELINPDNGWSHPVHIHFEEGIILSKTRSGVSVPVPAHERGRKDVYVLGPAESKKVFLRFRDFLGKYPMHCHNLVHEDHAMMIRWDIVA